MRGTCDPWPGKAKASSTIEGTPSGGAAARSASAASRALAATTAPRTA